MRCLIGSFALSATIIGALPGQSIPSTETVWSARIAVGMRRGPQFLPVVAEAAPNGWVSISILPVVGDAGMGPPPTQLHVEARDVKQWAARAREVLALHSDSATDHREAILGNGAYQIKLLRVSGNFPAAFSWRACGPGWGGSSSTLAEALDLVELLDSAATAAGAGAGQPPTLSRPYYASEVSCPVARDTASRNPRLPRGARVSRENMDIGAQFVVDTSGHVERETIEFLPGTPSLLAAAARAALGKWTYRSAEIDGMPVRQLVQTAVSFTPDHPPEALPKMYVEATNDGWVHVYQPDRLNGDHMQQWFEPDSIDVWVARIWGRSSIRGEPPRMRFEKHGGVMAGVPNGIALTGRLTEHANGPVLIAALYDCKGVWYDGEAAMMEKAEAFTSASTLARSHRAKPADPRRQAYAESNVACRAWLPWRPSSHNSADGLSVYPVGLYPESMTATNARADVLASFIVDTTGSVDPRSIVVMDDSDPRAAAAVPASLALFQFRPAITSGVKVRQRVIQAIRFEPPPICARQTAGPACPRRYSDK